MIAFDAQAGGDTGSGTTVTFSHTCTGSDRLLIVGCLGNNGDTITGVTYNSVAMTQINKQAADASAYIYIYALAAPATGANNVVVTSSVSTAIYGRSASYTGCAQTGIPDSQSTQGGTSSPSSTSTTTVADNSWTFLMARSNNNALTASTGSTARDTGATSADTKIFDSNGAITPAGSTSMTVTATSSTIYTCMMSFSPPSTFTPKAVMF